MDFLDDFLASAAARVEEERRRQTHDKPVYKVRLRVRLGGAINSDEPVLTETVLGHQMSVKSAERGAPLSSSDEIVIVATGFETEEGAASFGVALQNSLSVLGVFRGYPVDVADEPSSTQVSDYLVQMARERYGVTLRGNPRGVEVYLDDPSVIHIQATATGSVLYDPANVLGAVAELGGRVGGLDDRGREAALLLNAATMASHAVAQIALAVAAIELLAAGEKWNASQKAWIKSVCGQVEGDESLSVVERDELARALSSLFNFGALEKTRRLIRSLGADEILPRWEALYSSRSKLFHGAKRVTGSDLIVLGNEALEVCRAIVRAYLETRCGVWLP